MVTTTRLGLLLGLIVLAGCAVKPRTPQPPGPVVNPRQDEYPITTIPPPADVPRPKPLERTVAGVDTRMDLAPADTPVAIGWCGNAGTKDWEELAPDLQWYLVKVDGVQAPWGGVLTKGTDGCYRTEKRYTFAAGDHDLLVSLVLPAETVRVLPPPVPDCLPEQGCTRCVQGQDCYGAVNSPPLVVRGEVVVPTTPVDCAVTAWGEWSAWSPWYQNSPTTEESYRTRVRQIQTPPSGGGAECPPLEERETQTRPLQPPVEDVCKTTPLVVTVSKWPAAPSGTRAGQWNSGSFTLKSVQFLWNPNQQFVAVDTRGCTVTVNR